MPPQNTSDTLVTANDFDLVPDDEHKHIAERKFRLNLRGNLENLRNLDYSKVIWRNVFAFVILHIYSVYGLYLVFTGACMWKTVLFAYSLYFASAMGITMGVHRLWAHRSFKANILVRVILGICQTIAFQNSIFEWSRDHRAHHKYSETDADPHNAQRGFFFSHMGWLMYRKHPDVIKKGKTLDVSDLLADPVVRFQKKFYVPLVVLFCFALPAMIPSHYWGENWVTALMVAGFLRYCIVLHITWMVNSVAHWLGSKPFDKHIYPSQNSFVASLAMGEGWHNYHHVFPFDYRTAELGGLIHLNVTAVVIDLLAKIGWTYDLKTASREMSEHRAKRTGDGTHNTINRKNK